MRLKSTCPHGMMAGVVLIEESGGSILAPGDEDPLQSGNLIAGSASVCIELKNHLDRRLG